MLKTGFTVIKSFSSTTMYIIIQECQTLSTQIRDLVWVYTICKGYQLVTKVIALAVSWYIQLYQSHAYQTLECSTSGWILKKSSRKRIKNRGMSCNRLCIPTFVVKIRGQKVLSFVRFTFHVKYVYQNWTGTFFVWREKLIWPNENTFWARIYTTNAGIHRLLHDIPQFLFTS